MRYRTKHALNILIGVVRIEQGGLDVCETDATNERQHVKRVLLVGDVIDREGKGTRSTTLEAGSDDVAVDAQEDDVAVELAEDVVRPLRDSDATGVE